MECALVTAAFNQTQKSTCPYTSNRDVMHAAEEFHTAHDADLQLTYYSTHKLHSFPDLRTGVSQQVTSHMLSGIYL